MGEMVRLDLASDFIALLSQVASNFIIDNLNDKKITFKLFNEPEFDYDEEYGKTWYDLYCDGCFDIPVTTLTFTLDAAKSFLLGAIAYAKES